MRTRRGGGLGQRRRHPRRAYVTAAPSLAAAAGPSALPGLPAALHPSGWPGRGPIPMATGPRLGVGATVLFPCGSRIAGPQLGWLGEVLDPTALWAPHPSTMSPCPCETGVIYNYTPGGACERVARWLICLWTPEPGPVWSCHSGKTRRREGAGHVPGSGGGVGRCPRLKGPRRRTGHPETSGGGSCPSESLSGWGESPPMTPEGEKAWLLEHQRTHSPVATPPAPPSLCTRSLPSTERADGRCCFTCRLRGPTDQGQHRPPWGQVGHGALSSSRLL